MKNSVIRLIFALTILATIGIIASQIYWVKSALELQNNDFRNKVTTSLKNVANKIWELKRDETVVYNSVQEISPSYYIVQVNHQITPELLEHFLREQLDINGLAIDFEYGQYDCTVDSVINLKYVSVEKKKNVPQAQTLDFPKVSRENYYFAVYFPSRKEYIGDQMDMWIYSSFFLLLVLFLLGSTVVVILKQKRLREVQKDFVNNMTHEFKTPLATIQLSAEVLKKPEIIEKPQRLLNYATIIDKEASLLALQVERVLQMAHAEKGEIQLRKEKIEVQTLVSEVVDSFQGIAANKNATIEPILLEKSIYATWDILHVKNALGNLIENAIKYSGEDAHIIVRLRGNEKRIKIEVIDNGPGIAKEHQEMLFSKFFRVPTGNRHDVKGFGLGLNYVKIICKTHGGDVTLNSAEGKGSTFTMFLPTQAKSKK